MDVYSQIIERLEDVRRRPQMYTYGHTEREIFAYLAGFYAALRLCGYSSDNDVYWAICAERGWEVNSLGPQKRMRDTGWNDEAIVDEMLTIEIETWKRLRSRLSQQETCP